MGPEAAKAIGVRQLDAPLLLQMLSSLSDSWGGKSCQEDFSWMAWALSTIEPKASKYANALKALRIIPTLGGGAIAMGGEKTVAVCENLQDKPPTSCMRNTVMLDSAFYRAVTGAYPAAFSLLRRLGVCLMNDKAFVLQHVLPILADVTTPPEIWWRCSVMSNGRCAAC